MQRKARHTTTYRTHKTAKRYSISALTATVSTAAVCFATGWCLQANYIDETKQRAIDQLNIESSWNKSTGNYTHIGTYNQSPLKYRILAYDGDRLLLDCDSGVYKTAYHLGESPPQYWQEGDLANSLNGLDFYHHPEVFTETQRQAIAQTSLQQADSYKIPRQDETTVTYRDTSGTSKIFALSGLQAHALYETQEDRQKTMDSNYYWLGSLDGELDIGQVQAAVIDKQGDQLTLPASMSTVAVSPSFYLDMSQVTHIWPTDLDKSSLQVLDKDHYEQNEWTMTLDTGSGFIASRTTTSNSWGTGGSQVRIKLGSMEAPPEGVDYTQVSAILHDDTGTMRGYGSVGEIGDIKEGATVSLTIPPTLQGDSLSLVLFLEDTRTETHYASDAINFHLGTQGEIEEEIPQEEVLPEEDMEEIPSQSGTSSNQTSGATRPQSTNTPSVSQGTATQSQTTSTQVEEEIQEPEMAIAQLSVGGGTIAEGLEVEEVMPPTQGEWYTKATSAVVSGMRSILSWFKGEDIRSTSYEADMYDNETHVDISQESTHIGSQTTSTDSEKLGRARTVFTISLLLLTTGLRRSRKRKVRQMEIYRKNIRELI